MNNRLSDEHYKEGIRRYAQIYDNHIEVLEQLRDKYLDSVRLINEVIKEFD